MMNKAWKCFTGKDLVENYPSRLDLGFRGVENEDHRKNASRSWRSPELWDLPDPGCRVVGVTTRRWGRRRGEVAVARGRKRAAKEVGAGGKQAAEEGGAGGKRAAE